MSIPRVETYLPELASFTRELANDHSRGSLRFWKVFVERVRAFYSPSMMDRIEHPIPGWIRMASYTNQQTLIHVTSVLAALFLLPEYQSATADQQSLMMWMVLFHDVAKEAKPEGHDYIHAFRSGAVAGRALQGVGFPVTDFYPALIDDWSMLTHEAVIYDSVHDETIQDNRKLPEIISGIDRLYGEHTPAGWVIKAVLLHLSIATDPDYPTLASLTDTEIRQYIDGGVYPLLKAMMLVDNDGWNFFNPERQLFHRQQTLGVFDRIAVLIAQNPS